MVSQRAAAALPCCASCSPCSGELLGPRSLFSPFKASALLRAGTVMLSTRSGEASAACSRVGSHRAAVLGLHHVSASFETIQKPIPASNSES